MAAATLLAGTQFVSAQGGGGGGGGRGRGMANFTDDERAAVQAMNAETTDLQTKLTEARTALNDAIFAAKLDEAAVKDKAAAVAKIEADYSVARAKAFDKVRSKFSAESITALKAMGAGGGRGGARRGGGGGGGGGGI